ncbi:methionine--tRNA ligase [Nitrosophilus alvini]|uniref:methionine--tRNA ligase n=1 Tax=Nitrosophilus alvini TaxID=2714855 RepID=UPI00190DD04B|nr:methionine--tRNA ligase [Nitrosophilus alvini]
MSSKMYITTPIYYVNDVPHIGHAYTTIIADTVARYARLRGMDTFFLTGTDEHGQKIEQSAKAKGKTPQEYADEISRKFKELWDSFEISYDKFIRTTDKEHIEGVQKAFEIMYERGDIYKGTYEGHYCISCEAFFPESQLVDGEFCPDCGKETVIVKEESYFFRLSKYQEKLLDWYKSEEECILPKSKKNEVIKFVEGGLNDLSITRTSFDWGVKLPKSLNDPKHVMYVWLDALLNYITALGYGTDEKLMRYWPADFHLVGKDILRFHAVYWPAFLMSLGLPLPKHIAAHGWWTRDGEKMSKSKGNVVDPKIVADAYGLDNFRYFLLREVPFGQDGDFSQRALIDRINSDLSNDLGNLLNRIIGMSGKYFDHKISGTNVRKYHAREIKKTESIINGLEEYMFDMRLHKYLEELWKILGIANKSIDTYAPWSKMKEGKEDEAMATIALVANILAKTALMLHPVMPKTTLKIAQALGFEIENKNFEKFILQNELLPDFTIKSIPPLFPKIEKPLLEEKKRETTPKKAPKEEGIITIDDFFKVSLKIGTVIEAEEVPKSKKLLKLRVDLGEERPRQIIAGIKEFYSPEDLIGKQVCVVANLKPAKLMGLLSEGMILAARDENGLSLLMPETTKKPGTPVK